MVSPELLSSSFELDLCTHVVGVECPLKAGERFEGIAQWNGEWRTVVPLGLSDGNIHTSDRFLSMIYMICMICVFQSRQIPVLFDMHGL